jgi:hypothetical protein
LEKDMKFMIDRSELPYDAMVSDPAQLIPVEDDAVNHPSHYTSGSIEVIDFIEDQKLPYHLGNAVKYICRAGRKDPEKTVEDLQKAAWYIKRYIGLLQRDGENKR